MIPTREAATNQSSAVLVIDGEVERERVLEQLETAIAGHPVQHAGVIRIHNGDVRVVLVDENAQEPPMVVAGRKHQLWWVQ